MSNHIRVTLPTAAIDNAAQHTTLERFERGSWRARHTMAPPAYAYAKAGLVLRGVDELGGLDAAPVAPAGLTSPFTGIPSRIHGRTVV